MADWRARLEDEAEPVYPIGVVAELLEVSVQVVRRYDEPDLVAPERTAGGQRRYARRDIARLARVLELSEQGVSAPGIKRILALEDELGDQLPAATDTPARRRR